MVTVPSRHMFIASLAAALALSLGACASGQDDATSSSAPPTATATAPAATAPAATPGDAAAQCNAEAAQSFVGQDASEATIAQAQAAAGATGKVRMLKPGQPMTMDYRADRLNVEVDEHNAIVRITCG